MSTFSGIGRLLHTIIIVSFLPVAPLFGEHVPAISPDNLIFSKLTVEDGLSSNIITAICEDDRGFIWIGTKRGLNLYDGYTVKSFANNSLVPERNLDSEIVCMQTDHAGNLWIGTISGLYRFDYKLEKFEHYPRPEPAQNIIRSLYVDDDNNLWTGHDNGICRMIASSGEFERVLETDGTSIIYIEQDLYNNLYFGTSEKGFLMTGSGSPEVAKISLDGVLNVNNPDASITTTMTAGSDGILWFGASDGVYRAIAGTETTRIKPTRYDFRKSAEGNDLTNNKVHIITEDNDGNLWIGTEYGLNIYNPANGSLKNILNNQNDPSSLSNNLVHKIYVDSNGIIWIGTYQGGVNIYYPDYERFRNYFPEINNSDAQMERYIKAIHGDEKGDLWFGSDYGLMRTSFEKKEIKIYTHDPDDPWSLNVGGVSAILIDSRDRMWVGTWGGGVHEFDVENERFTRLPWQPDVHDDPYSQADINIRAIHEDSRGFLWFGNTRGFLDKYDPETKTFEHYYLGHPETGIDAEILYITSDPDDNIWFCTLLGGLFKKEPGSGKFTQYLSRGYQGDKAVGLLSGNDAHCILFTGPGTAWIGTNNGLDYVDFRSGETVNYNISNGLASNHIYNIQNDDRGNLWLSTPKGISKFNKERGVFINYDTRDGVRTNSEAGYKHSNGWILFGGVNGVNAFDPLNFRENEIVPPVVFTGFSIHNQIVEPGEGSVLPESINETSSVTLNRHHNVFSIEFAALNYMNPLNNKYMYMLEGFDQDWIYLGTTREVRYMNLEPGTYIFRVRGSNNDGLWNEEERVIEIIIMPPWWSTLWFRLLLLAFIVLIISAWIGIRTLRLKQYQRILKKQVEERTKEIEEQKIMIREQAARLHEADQMKIRFFTNISHEFRTPLTLILNPIDTLMNRIPEKYKNELPYTVVRRNILRMKKLINQFLDISKIEAKSLGLKVSKGNIKEFICEIANAYKMAIAQKNITFNIEFSPGSFICYFDADKIDKILYNLISNALRHTPAGGQIDLRIEFKAVDRAKAPLPVNPGNGQKLTHILIRVIDTGTGIPEDKLDRIFERFYQVEKENAVNIGGTGIGLSLTRDLVEIYRGSIEVESSFEKGTEFRVLLPVDRSLFNAGEVDEYFKDHDIIKTELLVIDDDGTEDDPVEEGADPDAKNTDRPLLLIVDDSRDILNYLRGEFREDYHVIMARDGKEGLTRAQKHLPQIIISDIMMPVINGYEFCEKIKSDMLTCHIPVILLTAKASDEDRLEGIEIGADAYISKPFEIDILKASVSQLIKSRSKIKQAFRREIILQPKEIETISPDEKLLSRIIDVLNRKIQEPEFGVEELGREVGLSRTHLYRKIKELTGLTAIEFIRNKRLECAASLLRQNKLYVSEIAYMCGFKELSYFRKVFKAVYSLSPQEYALSQHETKPGIHHNFHDTEA